MTGRYGRLAPGSSAVEQGLWTTRQQGRAPAACTRSATRPSIGSGQLEAAAFAGAEEDADFSDLAAGLVSDLLSLELELELDSDLAAALLDVSVERESVR